MTSRARAGHRGTESTRCGLEMVLCFWKLVSVVTEYKYLLLMRPPQPGAMPKDGLIYPEFKTGYSRKSHHHYWGFVVYSRELTKEEIFQYELEAVE